MQHSQSTTFVVYWYCSSAAKGAVVGAEIVDASRAKLRASIKFFKAL